MYSKKWLFSLATLLLFSYFIPISSIAQGWYKTYEDIQPSYEAGTRVFDGIIQTKDGGFFTWGSKGYNSGANNSPIDIVLTKTDLAGNVQWTQWHENGTTEAFSNLQSFTMVKTHGDNGYLAMGKTTNPTIPTFRGIHLNDSGEVISTFEFSEDELFDNYPLTGNSTTQLIDIALSYDNNFIVLGSNHAPYYGSNGESNISWVAKIDLTGNISWASIVDNQINTPATGPFTITPLLSGLAVSNQGEIMIGGISTPFNIQLLFKYDTNGNELWNQKTTIMSSNKFVNIMAHPTGDFYVQAVQAALWNWNVDFTRFNAQGDTVWTQYYDSNQEDFAPFEMCLLNDGNIGLMEIQKLATSGNAPQVTRFRIIDTNNNTLETGNAFPSAIKDYNYGEMLYGDGPNGIELIATSDNGMVAAGEYNIELLNTIYPYITKPNPDGTVVTNYISGRMYIDANDNCVYDAGEQGIPNQVVRASHVYALTDENGFYESNLVIGGDYLIETNFGEAYPYDLWGTNCQEEYELSTVEIDGTVTEGLDFGYYAEYECPRLEIDLSIGALFPVLTEFNNGFVHYENTGTLPEDSAYVYITMDPMFSISESSIPNVHDPITNTYEFFVGNLGLFEFGSFHFNLDMPSDLQENENHCFDSYIVPFDRCNLEYPDWDGSEVSVSATCEEPSVEFTIENTGEADMQYANEYRIYHNNFLIEIGTFQLEAGESMTLQQPGNGASYRIEADQSLYYPEPSAPVAFSEGCNFGDEPSVFGLINSTAQNNQASHVDTDCPPVRLAIDPNDKQVVPFGVGPEKYVKSDVLLEYTIRFQNTGTAPALNVFVLDTLSEHLDIMTLNSGAASHDYELSLLPGGVVRWDFYNIYLPDSASNLAGSNGSVSFSIRLNADVPQPMEVHNTAAIYFDYNPPVITEDIFVTVCDECLIQTLASDGVYFDGKVLLEGPYNGAGLMTNNLQELIPLVQPFASFPYLHNGTEQLEQIPSNMVDWVLVEARSGTPASGGARATTTVETKAAILLNDGSIRGLDGISGVKFENLTSDTPYHFCIRHRNHLDVLTATALLPNDNMVYDFTTGVSQAMGAAQMKWFGGDAKAVMYSGDFNGDGVIQTTDYDVWVAQPAAVEVYDMPDANLDGVIQVSDYDKWFFNKAKIGSVEIGF